EEEEEEFQMELEDLRRRKRLMFFRLLLVSYGHQSGLGVLALFHLYSRRRYEVRDNYHLLLEFPACHITLHRSNLQGLAFSPGEYLLCDAEYQGEPRIVCLILENQADWRGLVFNRMIRRNRWVNEGFFPRSKSERY